MMKIVFVVCIIFLGITQSEAFCIDNVDQQSEAESQKDDTKEMINGKQKDLEKAINAYKKALKKKKEMMTKLWKTTTEIEFLMKENQVIRRRMIKHWESVKNTH